MNMNGRRKKRGASSTEGRILNPDSPILASDHGRLEVKLRFRDEPV